MDWVEFLKKREAYKATWKKLRAEFSGDIRNYLENSYLIVVYAGYKDMPFELYEPLSIALQFPDFIIKDENSVYLLDIAGRYKASKHDDQRKQRIMKEVEKIDTVLLAVVDFQVEIRFSFLKFDYIQRIKQSAYCNTQLTDMSQLSIRVVIKEPV